MNFKKNIVLKRVEEVTSKYCRETIYTLYENVVTDKDIDASILETEQYREYTKNNITYNASTEIKNVTITNWNETLEIAKDFLPYFIFKDMVVA